MATVRKAPSIEHNFQLVITRVFEEGEEDILEEEEESAYYKIPICYQTDFEQALLLRIFVATWQLKTPPPPLPEKLSFMKFRLVSS